MWAANLADSEESAIGPREGLQVGGEEQGEVQQASGLPIDPWVALAIAAMGLLVVEWVTYNRRVTV